MKTTSILTTSVLALAGVILSTQAAHAVGNSQVSLGDNDLLMGFRAINTPGNTLNLELNLGNADSFYNPSGNSTRGDFTGAVVIPNIGRLSVTDLIDTYGPGWATRTDLFWGIAGTSSASGSFDGWFGLNTIYLSRPQTTVGVQTTPWARQTNFSNANTQVSSLGGPGGYVGNSTATSDYDVAVIASGANSYQTRSGGQPGQTFAAVSGAFVNDSLISTFGTGTWISVQDLFALEQGTGNGLYIGSIGIAANGRMDYSPTASYFAVPEPAAATYILGAFAAWVFRRRRNRSAVPSKGAGVRQAL